jgi:hypothetical protein
MPDETEDRDETTTEVESKPTITIAEKQGSQTSDAKPTITIAEKDGGN